MKRILLLSVAGVGLLVGPAASAGAELRADHFDRRSSRGRVYDLGGARVSVAPPVVSGAPANLRARVTSQRVASVNRAGTRSLRSPAVIHRWTLDAGRTNRGIATVTSRIELGRGEVLAAALPGLDGQVRKVAWDDGKTWPARYVLGRGAAGPAVGTLLALPAVGLVLSDGRALGVAFDPYYGVAFQPQVAAERRPALESASAYDTSLVPLDGESRTCVVAVAAEAEAALFSAFYATIPDIRPGPAWLHGIRLVYYDYLSDSGQGWFRDIDELARRIPTRAARSKVLLCLHGWYDYLGRYAFDEARGRMDRQWTAFPATRKTPMSLAELRRRLAYARDRGFRVVLYFADGVLADDRAPGFDAARVYVDANGRADFPVWHGPDTVGTNRYQDPSHPAVRRHYAAYLEALLREFGNETDGFVWDETFYLRREWESRTRPGTLAPADRAMLSMVAELTRMTQARGKGRLAFLVSDCLGITLYGSEELPVPNALVAHGTYQDTGGNPAAWAGNLLPNYRNVLFSCMWEPIKHPDWNRINVEQWRRPQALSNGWGDDEGPAEMAVKHPAQLDEVLRRFHAEPTPHP
jgi:hypothetical protein